MAHRLRWTLRFAACYRFIPYPAAVSETAMPDPAAKRDVIARNYDAFEAMLPLLLADRRGEFALLRDGAIAGFFASAGEAQNAGMTQFADALFSVQKVEDRAVDLGFYSYARYRRVT